MLEGDLVEPFELLEQVALDGEDDGGAVEPDGVVRGVHADDVPRELEDSFRFLVLGHDGAEVGHGLAVLFRVGNGCEGVWAAIVLRNGYDVFPFLGVAIFAHRDGCQVRMILAAAAVFSVANIQTLNPEGLQAQSVLAVANGYPGSSKRNVG